MIDFDLFVQTLGPYAKQYTPEQLKQLHVEVRKLAEVLLSIREEKQRLRRLAVGRDAATETETVNNLPDSVPLASFSQKRFEL